MQISHRSALTISRAQSKKVWLWVVLLTGSLLFAGGLAPATAMWEPEGPIETVGPYPRTENFPRQVKTEHADSKVQKEQRRRKVSKTKARAS